MILRAISRLDGHPGFLDLHDHVPVQSGNQRNGAPGDKPEVLQVFFDFRAPPDFPDNHLFANRRINQWNHWTPPPCLLLPVPGSALQNLCILSAAHDTAVSCFFRHADRKAGRKKGATERKGMI